jgi:hypothetical protein
MDAAELDWDGFKRQFQYSREMLTPYEGSSAEDFEELKLSRLTHGQISSAHIDKINYSVRFYADDANTRAFLEGAMRRLGFRGDKPPGWRSPFDIVSEAIEKRAITPEFVSAWGTLQYCTGLITAFILRDDQAEADIRKKLEGAMQGTTAQEHWYAHWMTTNAPSLEHAAREKENVRLALLCEDIEQDNILTPKIYPKEWFSRMLEHDNQGQPTGDLKSTYIRLSKKKIREMIQHRDLTPEVLPPLRPEEFQRIGDNQP